MIQDLYCSQGPTALERRRTASPHVGGLTASAMRRALPLRAYGPVAAMLNLAQVGDRCQRRAVTRVHDQSGALPIETVAPASGSADGGQTGLADVFETNLKLPCPRPGADRARARGATERWGWAGQVELCSLVAATSHLGSLDLRDRWLARPVLAGGSVARSRSHQPKGPATERAVLSNPHRATKPQEPRPRPSSRRSNPTALPKNHSPQTAENAP